MPTIWTLGQPRKRTQFTYHGNVKEGVTLYFANPQVVSADFFRAIFHNFAGSSLPGGFDMTDPIPGGLGEWIQLNSPHLNEVSLTPRHGSFIAAILVHEGYITSSLEGNKIMLYFPQR